MEINLLKSKILRAEVTETHRDYEGSLAIDEELMEHVKLMPYEKLLVGNITSGERFETYAIAAPKGSKTISLNGAAAHKGQKGDFLVVMSFASLSTEEAANWEPSVLVLADRNTRIVEERQGVPPHPNPMPL